MAVSEKAKRKEVEKKEEEKSEAQKKPVVGIAQRASLELLCVGKERRRFEEKRQREEIRVPGRNNFWEALEDGSSFS